jgi:hypothetical protein
MGFSQIYANTITRRRVSANNTFLADAPIPNLTNCHSCRGVRPAEECCNSCEELLLLHALEGQNASIEEWEQCDPPPRHLPTLNEKCVLKGKLTVNRVPGVFGVHFTRLFSGANTTLDASHVIGRLRFGPKVPSASMPLEAIRMPKQTTVALYYHYILLCTPVIFVRDGITVTRTYEYAPIVTWSFPNEAAGIVPGAFFSYKFTPHTVTVTCKTKSLGALISATFGVLSGGYAITSFLDRILYRTSNQKILE